MKNKITLIVFLLLMITSLFLASRVSVNYNLEEYLPKDSMITQGISVYTNEFGDSSQATFSFDEISISKALALKEDILLIDEVDSILFIDDYFNELTYGLIRENLPVVQQNILDAAMNNLLLSGLSYPEAFLSLIPYMPAEAKTQFEDQFVKFVSDEEMLMHVIFNTKSADLDTEIAIDEIKALLDDGGYEYYFTGNAVSSIFTKNTIESEVLIITLICIPLVLVVLLFMSKSFFDIVIFGIIVGISIIINLGTNVLLPSISFITQSMAIALQLAISLDYVIFMLSAYHQARADGEAVDESLKSAKKKTSKPIIASALTTGASFLALVFMRFTIGFDIGVVFAKAIIISLITTIILLPILIKYFHKILNKTTKKSKSIFKGTLSKKLYKFRYFSLIFLLIILGGSIYFQTQNNYTYGSSSFAGTAGTSYSHDLNHIETEFGKSNPMTVIVNKDDVLESALYANLTNLEYVDNINAGIYYKGLINDPAIVTIVTDGLYSENYALIQFNLDSDIEGEEAFGYYEEIEALLENSNATDFYVLGDTAVAYNIKDTVEFDYKLVMVIALVSIMIIILISFKNLLLPLILPIVIETSVLFTMALLYFLNSEVVFLASLIVSAILLGVTIDYAILLGKGYMYEREKHDKQTSIECAIKNTAPSIVTSALLFSIAGLTISIISSIKTISQIGLIIAIGAVTSLFYVLLILPQILSIFDKWIYKSKIK